MNIPLVESSLKSTVFSDVRWCHLVYQVTQVLSNLSIGTHKLHFSLKFRYGNKKFTAWNPTIDLDSKHVSAPGLDHKALRSLLKHKRLLLPDNTNIKQHQDVAISTTIVSEVCSLFLPTILHSHVITPFQWVTASTSGTCCFVLLPVKKQHHVHE